MVWTQHDLVELMVEDEDTVLVVADAVVAVVAVVDSHNSAPVCVVLDQWTANQNLVVGIR